MENPVCQDVNISISQHVSCYARSQYIQFYLNLNIVKPNLSNGNGTETDFTPNLMLTEVIIYFLTLVNAV